MNLEIKNNNLFCSPYQFKQSIIEMIQTLHFQHLSKDLPLIFIVHFMLQLIKQEEVIGNS